MAASRSDYAWIALNMIPGLGSTRVRNLLEHFGSPEKILHSPPGELRKARGIGKEFASRLSCFNPEKEVERELKLAGEKNVAVVTIENPGYPPRLKEIFDPPLALYVAGGITPRDENAVAMVGTRHPSFYGKMVAEDLARKFAARGVTVVSGMARGIDTASHRGAVSAGGRTIAVLGCGLDVCYPPENAKIMGEIASRGAVISEFPMGTPPDKGNFPRRNRIISGLSLGVIVVEAAQRSGSLITASLALEQGREVFSVPGKVDSPKSTGTNALIKEGAKLVNCVDDVMEELLPGFSPARGENPAPGGDSLSPEEESVLARLSSEPAHVDSISGDTGLPASRLSSALMMLEMKGLVKQLPGKMFAKNTME